MNVTIDHVSSAIKEFSMDNPDANGSAGRRVVITGLGIVSSIGIGKEQFWESLRSGKSGIKKIDLFDVSNYQCQIGGEISDFDPISFMPAQLARRLDRFAQLGVTAAILARDDARLNLDETEKRRIGAIIGTSLGTLAFAEQQFALYHEKGLKRINPFFATSVIPSSCATQIMINLGIQGPCHTITTACASSADAIGMGAASIRNGEVDVAFVGGAEAPFCSFVLATLTSMGLLTTNNTNPKSAYRPYCRESAGFALGEAGVIVVLEDLHHALKRDASIYGEIAGFGSSSDAHHIMDFSPDLRQASRAIKMALSNARLSREEIEYANAHGTAIRTHDISETKILKKVFGNLAYKIPVSTTKPFTGHVLGASGGVGLAACALMMQRGYLHPTLNFGDSVDECDLDYIPNYGYQKNVNTMLLMSFGFGGYNSALILKSYR
jgi:3-oxoacyl-[acyl-carrier-protein] synthase II